MLLLPRQPIATALTLILLSRAIPAVAEEDAVTRGEYLVHAGGCFSCHTVAGGEKLAEGRALATPFGTFYSPNIHPIRKPVSATGPTRRFCKHCARACGPTEQTTFRCSHIRTSPASPTATPWRSRPICSRSLQCAGKTGRTTWPSHSPGASCKLLFFTPGPFQPAPQRSIVYNRGAYLVTALAHCGECHTTRNFLGATRPGQWLGGTPDGPDGQLVPNIAPDPDNGIRKWEEDDVVELLRTGTTPEQSKVKGAMWETIDDGLKNLSNSGLEAIADYLFAQAPIVHDVSRKR